jgi:hypothetical protein
LFAGLFFLSFLFSAYPRGPTCMQSDLHLPGPGQSSEASQAHSAAAVGRESASVANGWLDDFTAASSVLPLHAWLHWLASWVSVWSPMHRRAEPYVSFPSVSEAKRYMIRDVRNSEKIYLGSLEIKFHSRGEENRSKVASQVMNERMYCCVRSVQRPGLRVPSPAAVHAD